MPVIHPKSSEQIQAQVAAYADENAANENAANERAQDSILEIATNVETLEPTESATEALASVAAEDYVKQDYIGWLRVVHRLAAPQVYEPIQDRANLLEAYTVFQPAVQGLKDSLSSEENTAEPATLLGQGASSSVYRLQHDNKQYAVRILDYDSAFTILDYHIASAPLGKNLPGFEQIVAASYSDKATIAEVMPGQSIAKLDVDVAANITNAQIAELADMGITSQENGIGLDINQDNFLYDPQAGFGVVDYLTCDIGEDPQIYGGNVGSLAFILANVGRPDRAEMTRGDYAHDASYMTNNLRMLETFRAAVARKLAGDKRMYALSTIGFYLENIEEQIGQYNNPEWVAQQLAEKEI